MKIKIISLLAVFAASCSLNAAVTLSGTSLLNAPGLAAGKNALYVVGAPAASFDPTADLVANYPNALGTQTSSEFFGTISLASGVSFDQAPYAGQQFYVLVFDSSPLNEAAPGDTFSVWTDATWIVPAADGLFSFNDQFAQVTSAATGGGSVNPVPEPSSFALLAGCFGMAWMMVRRRS